MKFDLSDGSKEMLFNIARKALANHESTLNFESVKSPANELQDAFSMVAMNGKILFDECLKQGFDKDEAINFSASFLGKLSK